MIVTKKVKIDNKNFIRTYSDENFYIKKVGTDEVYSEAYDLPKAGFTYEETEDKIEEIEDDDTDNS